MLTMKYTVSIITKQQRKLPEKSYGSMNWLSSVLVGTRAYSVVTITEDAYCYESHSPNKILIVVYGDSIV